MIVLDRVDNSSREIDATSVLTSELSMEYGISLSRIFATEEQWRKRSSVHGAFGRHFAKTGLIDPKFHRWLLDSCAAPRTLLPRLSQQSYAEQTHLAVFHP